jgi:hypothetical protein
MVPDTVGLSARQLAPDAITCRAVHRLVNKVEAVVAVAIVDESEIHLCGNVVDCLELLCVDEMLR